MFSTIVIVFNNWTVMPMPFGSYINKIRVK